MSQQTEEIKVNVQIIQQGLRKMGANRAVALSVHVTKELIEDMEQAAARLSEQLDSL